MAVDLLAEIRKLLGMAEADGDGIREADVAPADETPADETPADESPADETPADETPAEDEPVLEAGEGASNAVEAASDTGAETMPASEVSLAELRDRLNKMAAENESLRNRVAELGGDASATLEDEGIVDSTILDEAIEPYDDEAAQADLDEQAATIARLRG